MKKILKTLVCSALLLGGVVSIAGCNNNNTSQSSSKASTSSQGPVKPDINVEGTKYEFNSVNGYAESIGSSVGSSDDFSYVSDMSLENESKLTFNITSSKAKEVTMIVKVGSVFTKTYVEYTSLMRITVNGKDFTSKTTAPRASNQNEKSFGDLNLGKINLKEGENIISFSVRQKGYSLSFVKLTLVGDEDLLLRWTNASQGYQFNAIDDKTIIEGGFNKNKNENCAGVSAYTKSTIIFRLNASEEDENAKISVVLSGLPTQYKFTDRFTFTINGVEQTSEALIHTGQQWNNYKAVELGTYKLRKGKNVIMFSYDPTPGQVYNFRSLNIESSKTITWYEDIEITIPETATDKNFKALESNVILSGEKDGSPVLKKSDNEDCIGVNEFGGLGTITYKLNSTINAPAKISVEMSCETSEYNFADVFTGMLNGDILVSNAKTPVGAKWTEYKVIEIGNYELLEGLNTLSFSFIPQTYNHFNFRSITVTTEADVSLYEEQLPENATTNTFNVTTSNVVVQGENEAGILRLYKSSIGENGKLQAYSAGKGSFEYTINSSKSALAEVSIKLGCWNAPSTRIDNKFEPKLNGKNMSTDSKTPLQDGEIVTLGKYDLQEGINKFSFTETIFENQSNDFYDLIIKTDAELSIPTLSIAEETNTFNFNSTDDKVKVEGTISQDATENKGLQIIYKNTSNKQVCPYKEPKNNELSTITYKFTSSKATTAKMILNMSGYNSWDQSVQFIFNPSLNGENLATDSVTKGKTANDVTEPVEIGIYNIVEGENVIVLKYSPRMNQCWHNIGDLTLITDANLELIQA